MAMTLEDLLKAIESKVSMLEIVCEDVPNVLTRNHIPSMERKSKIIQTKLSEMYELITKTQESKIESGENKDKVREWSVEIESEIWKYENRLKE